MSRRHLVVPEDAAAAASKEVPHLVPVEPSLQDVARPPRSLPVNTLPPEAFYGSFGRHDFGRAVCGFTNRVDTEMVLTLLAHARPQRILEIGTAGGHMTANLTQWSPETAQIFSIGVIADLGIPTIPAQRHDDPPRSSFARFANRFGKVHKVYFITADSLHYDFRRLAPLDFVFVDGAHDLRCQQRF